MAEPAKLKSSRVQTIKELDQDIDRALPPASEIGVDLSALMSFLSPQEQVQEEDVPWDYDLELQKLASQMAAEEEGERPKKADNAGSASSVGTSGKGAMGEKKINK